MPILMQKSFWWWQLRSNRYIISLFPHLPTLDNKPHAVMVSVDVKHHVYLLSYCHHQNDFCIKVGSDESRFNVS